jgi:uncharacterized protein (DUF58 family)
MTVPARPILFWSIMLAVLLIGAVEMTILIPVVLLADIGLVAFCLWAGRRLARLPVTVVRDGWRRFQLNREADFVYRIENRGDREIEVSLRQIWPESIEAVDNRLTVLVQPREMLRVALLGTPRSRGRITVPPTEVDIRYPWGWARRRWSIAGDRISVYPDLESLYEYDTLRRSHALNLLGIRRMRQLGAGREFEQLREYLPDDDYRDINWKATARRRRPITNVYQTERSQDMLLCLDCGRMMGNPVGAGTALDRAIDACIMLAHVCCRQGDRVGLSLFKESVDLFLKPKGGISAVHEVIEQLVDVEPEGVFPSYSALVEALRVTHKRRSMVFLFTDLNDPQLATNLSEVLPLVSRRHVIVVVSLRDPLLDRVATGPAADRDGVYQVLAARALVSEREARSRELVQRGVQVLEADADSITLKVINRYLEIKMRQLL